MKLNALCVCLATLLLVSPVAMTKPSETLSDRANAAAERITDAEKFVNEVKESVRMARNGDYGKLKRGAIGELEDASDTIADLLDGHEKATDLRPDERIDLYNAQELIASIIRDDDKNRIVCKRVAAIGTRLAKAECMTIAQREAKAKAAKELVKEFGRTVCNPSETRLCDGG
jgi:hypothetical protein